MGIPLWPIGAGVALIAAIGIGDPSSEHLMLLGTVVALGLFVAGAFAPMAGYLVLVASCVMTVVVSIGGGERTVMPFDLLLLPLIVGLVLTRGIRKPITETRSPERVELDRATHRFTSAAWLYVTAAAASLLVTVGLGATSGALDSGLKLARAAEGMLMFGVGMASIRDRRGLDQVAGALMVGGLMFAAVNFTALALQPLTSDNTIRRAAMTWFTNEPGWSIGGPNEAGIALLLLWVVMMGIQIHRPRPFIWALMGLTLVLLMFTQSRSGLLAWLTFTVLTWRRLPRRAVVLGAIGLAIATPFVTTIWWERIVRTLSGERGSFEVYTTLVRVYGWFAAVRMFLDHPIVGVGYLGFRHFSDRYNELGLMLGTCENIFLETATGMGILGLILFGRALWRTLQLGDAVAKHASPESLAATFARLHRPYLIALVVSNLTCDNWIGLVGVAQTAVWCALLVRSGQLALTTTAES